MREGNTCYLGPYDFSSVVLSGMYAGVFLEVGESALFVFAVIRLCILSS